MLIFILAACGSKEEKTKVRLTSRERARIDTLYMQRVKNLRANLDSICEERRGALVAKTVDSLIIVRKAEEAMLRARIPMEK